jgi:hypothetical protein
MLDLENVKSSDRLRFLWLPQRKYPELVVSFFREFAEKFRDIVDKYIERL